MLPNASDNSTSTSAGIRFSPFVERSTSLLPTCCWKALLLLGTPCWQVNSLFAREHNTLQRKQNRADQLL